MAWKSTFLLFGAFIFALLPDARAVTVTVTRADCSKLVAHNPAPGTGAEYKPGVDAYGRKVAPADPGGAPAVSLPEVINIPITVELAARFGIPATADLYKGDAEIGTAWVRLQDGRAWFNDQPLTSAESHAIAEACKKVMAGGG